MSKKTTSVLVALLLSLFIHAQTDLVCIQNSTALGGFAYCEIDLANDTLIEKTLLPGYTGSLFVSSAADAIHSIYYVSDGTRLYGVNTITDSVELNLVLPLSGNLMTTIQYNPCDSTIYGLVTSTSFFYTAVCSFRPSDSLFTTHTSATGNFHPGQQGAIDPGNNIYIFENGSTSTSFVGGYDIAQDTILFNAPVSTANPSLSFRGISYDCSNARIVGLEIRSGPQEIYLSTVDVLTGNLTQISSVAVPNTSYFSIGGAAMDHTNGTYYYSSTTLSISSFDNSGNNHATDSISPAGMSSIETMTGCSCSISTNIMEERAITIATWPNPFTDAVNFSGAEGYTELVIYNSLGAIIYSEKVNSTSVTVDGSAWATGLYTYQFKGDGRIATGTFVKE